MNTDIQHSLNSSKFEDAFRKYSDACLNSGWFSINESYKFKFAHNLRDKINFEQQSDEEILTVCREESTTMNFLVSRKRYQDEILEMNDIVLLRRIHDQENISKEILQTKTMSYPKFSILLATLFPKKYYTVATEDIFDSLAYLYDWPKIPKKGFPSFEVSQILLKEIREELQKHSKELTEIFNREFPDRTIQEVDWIWFTQDYCFFIFHRILTRNYWIFQCNPDHFDIISALRDEKITAWTVNQHRNEIKNNDKFILWVTGEQSGCYGIGTVTSDVTLSLDDPEEENYWISKDRIKEREMVEVRIDYNLHDSPILKAQIQSDNEFNNFKGGKQGTNFTATKAQYEKFIKLIEVETRYYCVTAFWGHNPKGQKHQNARFINENIWENKPDEEKHDELVKKIPVGSYLVIKAVHPGDFSKFSVKAVGQVVHNHGDGKRLDMSWQKPFQEFDVFGLSKAYRSDVEEIIDKEDIQKIFKDLVISVEAQDTAGGEQRLIHQLRSYPHRSIVEKFYLFLEILIEENQLKDEDERLNMSIRNDEQGLLAVTINQRYVIWLEYRRNPSKKDSEIDYQVGFIFPLDQATSFQHHQGYLAGYSFDKMPGEQIAPASIYFDFTKINAEDKELIENWLAAVNYELNRAGKSGFRAFHNSSYYKSVVDKEYRTTILNKVYNTMIEDKSIPLSSRNIIFYGPPGTGKTYFLKNKLFKYFIDEDTRQSRSDYITELADLPWWKIFAIVLIKNGQSDVSSILEDELTIARAEYSNNKNVRATIWGELQKHTMDDCENVNFKVRQAPQCFFKNDKSKWEIKSEILQEGYPELITAANRLKNFKEEIITEKRYEFCTFHQSYSYEDFIEGIKPVLQSEDSEIGEIGYHVETGIFKRLCQKARNNPKKKYALFIDEINRGNISKIFGELITLIEEDKREGAENEIEILLPYSKEEFTVPQNLYIIGTMNTADRSIALIDTALRRRFSFIELRPDPSIPELDRNIAGIHLGSLLGKINDRIEFLYDRDHTIGHSYLMTVKDFNELCEVFRNKIIPLLSEYFYNDWKKISLVLGDNEEWKKEDEYRLIRKKKTFSNKDEEKLFGADLEEYEEVTVYEINDKLASEKYDQISPETFIQIYLKPA